MSKRKSDNEGDVYFASDRYFCVNGQWYFNVRTNDNGTKVIGGFNTKPDAIIECAMHVDLYCGNDIVPLVDHASIWHTPRGTIPIGIIMAVVERRAYTESAVVYVGDDGQTLHHPASSNVWQGFSWCNVSRYAYVSDILKLT